MTWEGFASKLQNIHPCSRSSVVSSSSCLPRSSSRSSSISTSSQYNWLRELHRKIRRDEEAVGKYVGNKSSNHHSKPRERRQAACEHLLQKKHKYCSVCYLCTRCGEVFLRYQNLVVNMNFRSFSFQEKLLKQ